MQVAPQELPAARKTAASPLIPLRSKGGKSSGHVGSSATSVTSADCRSTSACPGKFVAGVVFCGVWGPVRGNLVAGVEF
jgi:hypothetical protein